MYVMRMLVAGMSMHAVLPIAVRAAVWHRCLLLLVMPALCALRRLQQCAATLRTMAHTVLHNCTLIALRY
jgi:hypothetical protein